MPETKAMTAAEQAIRLLLVDDHALFREAVAEKLAKEPDMTVAAACGSAAEALRFLQAGVRPTMILLDFDLGPERVTDFVANVQETGFGGHILVVTAGVSGREAIQLIQAGVHGIFHKHNTPKTLCDIIRRVASGEVYLEDAYLGSVFNTFNQAREAGEPRLTERDKAILRFVFEGLANKQIAASLQVSEGAVKSSISQLFQKLGVRSRAQLVKIALERYGDQL